MFFNQLGKYGNEDEKNLTTLLKKVISEPKDLKYALKKIDHLESRCLAIYNKAPDKRKAPNPKSIGYFLSYFWQIYNPEKWPILYTSQINAYQELNLWEENSNQSDTYEFFHKLNEEVKEVISSFAGRNISNWEAEHALWNFMGNPNKSVPTKSTENTQTEEAKETQPTLAINPSFKLTDYLIPRVANLVELGGQSDKSAAAKGIEYERLVAEIFKQLDFEVDPLGQGKGRNPDALIKFREENSAFLVDAKAYSSGYSLGIDDRAIKEYINHYSPKLIKNGYKKIGFIIVSNSFKSDFDAFVNDVTWNTDIKRFILLTSEALLYLLAYKTKDRLPLSTIIEKIIALGNPIEAKDIIAELDDV